MTCVLHFAESALPAIERLLDYMGLETERLERPGSDIIHVTATERAFERDWPGPARADSTPSAPTASA